MARLGLLATIHPDSLTPQDLLSTVLVELGSDLPLRPSLDLAALPTLTNHIAMLLNGTYEPAHLESITH
jgi:predicted glycosyltransferase